MEKLVADTLLTGNAKLKRSFRRTHISQRSLAAALLLLATVPSLQAREKDKSPYGEGLIVNVPYPEPVVEQVVQDVAQNGIIRGTKEYNKDQYIGGATAANSTRVFPPWTGGGKVFYKVRLQALDPRNFKDSGDVGTLAVRYVLQPQGDKNTVLRIDAIFVEDFRRIAHASNGSVEGSEYKDIHDHLDALDVMKQQTEEAEQEHQQQRLKKQSQEVSSSQAPTPAPVAESAVAANTNLPSNGGSAPEKPAELAPGQTLEQHVQDLRRQVERLVKAPGAPLKSAPFHTASTLSPLPTGTEVLILISTPYWYGVETRDGQHGWIFRDELEALP
ncbi:MAG TPA: hypothetical protein VKF84_06050 [Candidatus Sulfotelmatobacter sp.]|nr:hypothetical protein [Candidatus Sulfotelmatobacter sp.]